MNLQKYHLLVCLGLLFALNMYLLREDSVGYRILRLEMPSQRQGEASSSDPWLDAMDAKFAAMRSHIASVCRKYGVELKRALRRDPFCIDPKDGLALCAHAKVSSSTLKNHFEQLQKSTDQKGLCKLKGQWSSMNLEQLIRNGSGLFIVTFVRHPFERLVSAFENRVITKLSPVPELARKSFPDFVRHIIEERKHCKSAVCLNAHWKPYNEQCPPCDIPFDVVGKLESFSDDIRYIFSKRNLTQYFPEQKIKSKLNQRKHASVALPYFAKLSQAEKRGLYEIYKYDFELFGYSAEEYVGRDAVGSR